MVPGEAPTCQAFRIPQSLHVESHALAQLFDAMSLPKITVRTVGGEVLLSTDVGQAADVRSLQEKAADALGQMDKRNSVFFKRLAVSSGVEVFRNRRLKSSHSSKLLP